jgi:hypothetical protein
MENDIQVLDNHQIVLDNHVLKIQSAIENVRLSIFNLVSCVKIAYDDLGEDTFQKDLANRLNMNPSTLSRWKNIGESTFLTNNQSSLPETFSTLYDLTQLEKKYVDEYGENDGQKRLQKLIDQGKVSLKSKQTDIKELLSIIDKKTKAKKKKQRENNILGLVNKSISTTTSKETLDELLMKGSVFKSFVIIPPDELLSRWGNEGYSDEDIYQEFPIAELRSPSVNDVIQCLILVPGKKINTGLKILSGFGFNYRDMFIPTQMDDGLKLIKSEKVILRGERGSGGNIKNSLIDSYSINDILKFSESIGSTPSILVFEDTDQKGWTCVTK